MKKLPIILSSLALAGVASPVSAAIELTEEDYLRPGETINAVQGGIWVTQVYPYTSEVTVDISHYLPEERRQLSKVYLSSYDYKAGVSIAEADERAKSLGEIPFEGWMGKMLEHTVTNQAISSTVKIGYMDLTKTNPTDIIYYAFKLENPDDPEVEPEWIRGKVDYRECVHSSPFETKKASVCRLMQNGTTGEYYYAPKNYGRTNDPVLSWPAELRMLLEEQWETIDAEIKALEQRHDNYQEISIYSINGEIQAVDKFEGLASKVGHQEDYAVRIIEMRARIEALKTPKEKPIEPVEPEIPVEPETPVGPNPEKPEEPEGPITPVDPDPEEPGKPIEPEEKPKKPEETGGDGGTGEPESPVLPTKPTGAEGDKNKPENGGSGAGNASIRPVGGTQSNDKSETQSDGSTNVSAPTTAATSPTGQNYVGVATDFWDHDEDLSANDKENVEETDNDARLQEENEDEIALPKLGGDETENVNGGGNLWWLWATLIIMAGGFTAWRVKRSNLKKGKNSL